MPTANPQYRTAGHWTSLRRFNNTASARTQPIAFPVLELQLVKMVVVNYLLFESAVGFSVFEVSHQADAVGLELPEVKEAMKSLDKFGKMVQLRSFNPWT